MPPVVIREPKLEFVWTPDGTTPTAVDMSCYSVAVEVSSDTETIDIGTFCNPNATELGRTTESIVCAFLWEEALYTALSTHVGDEFELRFYADKDDTNAVVARCRYGAMPWGRFAIGERVEVDLTLAVLTTLEYKAPTPITP